MPLRTVWVDNWQMQCCGQPFAVDSLVEWTTVRVTDPADYAELLDAETAASITDHEEHHTDRPTDLQHIRGLVRQIDAVYGRYRLDGQTALPVPGSGVLAPRTSVDGWEDDDSGDGPRFVGYLVRVDADPRAMFLFGDGDLRVEPSLRLAAAYMEPIDVHNGEYEAVFDESGRRYSFAVAGGATILEPTDEVAFDELVSRLRSYLQAVDAFDGVDPDDPLGVAVAVTQREWDHRWPRRPKWFARRLHGEGPRVVP